MDDVYGNVGLVEVQRRRNLIYSRALLESRAKQLLGCDQALTTEWLWGSLEND